MEKDRVWDGRGRGGGAVASAWVPARDRVIGWRRMSRHVSDQGHAHKER